MEMNLFYEIIKFIFLSMLIVLISKYVLVKVLRRLSEALNLKPKTVGNIAGAATSVPELLTVSLSAITGLIGASAFNILSSNIINLIQYLYSIIINKNQKVLKNKAIKIDIVIVIVTIIIPIIILAAKIENNLSIVPALILIMVLIYFINENAHKLYLNKQDTKINNQIKNEIKWVRGKTKIIIINTVWLLFSGVLLYIIGTFLSENITNLCKIFMIPQYVVGIALGFITSIPELITFIEAQKHHNKSDNEIGVIEATNNLVTSNVSNLFVIQTLGIILYIIFN